MLNQIIAKFLKISLDQATSLMEILKLEKRFQKIQEHKGQTLDPNKIQTQAEFLQFLQMIGQSHWFKGHDRTLFPQNIDDKEIQKKYFDLYKKFGIVDELKFQEEQQPDFSLVLGSSESQVALRAGYLAKNLKEGIIPKQQVIFGLGCNRDLGASVPEPEEKSKQKLLEQKKDLTEMGMVSLITEECIEKFKAEHKESKLTYLAVEVSSPAKSRLDPTCVKTTDTAIELKRILETDERFSKLPRPLTLAVYSHQPFADRQGRDMREKLGSDYMIVAVGNELTLDIFNKYPNSISICLGEIARTINISYTKKDYLKNFQDELTKEELNELQNLCKPAEQINSEISVILPPGVKVSAIGKFSVEKDKSDESLSNANAGLEGIQPKVFTPLK